MTTHLIQSNLIPEINSFGWNVNGVFWHFEKGGKMFKHKLTHQSDIAEMIWMRNGNIMQMHWKFSESGVKVDLDEFNNPEKHFNSADTILVD